MSGGQATGEYEDFLTGFVTSAGNVWGRPVGVAVDRSGQLFVTDDGGNRLWRVRGANATNAAAAAGGPPPGAPRPVGGGGGSGSAPPPPRGSSVAVRRRAAAAAAAPPLLLALLALFLLCL